VGEEKEAIVGKGEKKRKKGGKGKRVRYFLAVKRKVGGAMRSATFCVKQEKERNGKEGGRGWGRRREKGG